MKPYKEFIIKYDNKVDRVDLTKQRLTYVFVTFAEWFDGLSKYDKSLSDYLK